MKDKGHLLFLTNTFIDLAKKDLAKKDLAKKDGAIKFSIILGSSRKRRAFCVFFG